MALTYKNGNFLLNSATGNQTINTGTGVDGKVLILYGTNQTGLDAFANGLSGFFGCASNSTSRSVIAWAADNNVATTNSGMGSSNALCLRLFSAGTPTVDAEADFVSFGTGASSGQFTINVTDAPTSNTIVHYIYLGGTDIINANIVRKTQSTSTGSQAVTGVGFKGDAAIMFGTAQTTEGNSAECSWFIGSACQTAAGVERSVVIQNMDDGDTHTPISEYVQSPSSVMGVFTADALNSQADITSFDSDGFTLNWTDAASSAWVYFALVIKGGTWSVDTVSCPAATGSQSVSVGFTPKGVFFFGPGKVGAAETEIAPAGQVIGSYDGSGENAIWTGTNNALNALAQSYTSNTKVIFSGLPTGTTSAAADGSSLDANGYSLSWTTVTSSATTFSLAVGNSLNIAGVTRNASGTALGSCDVYLIKENSFGSLTVMNSATSNATTGAYSFKVYDNVATYFTIAFKSGTPNVMDITDRTLSGA
jgi:hypothetical protein